jgi:hypothetical protein
VDGEAETGEAWEAWEGGVGRGWKWCLEGVWKVTEEWGRGDKRWMLKEGFILVPHST